MIWKYKDINGKTQQSEVQYVSTELRLIKVIKEQEQMIAFLETELNNH